MPDAWLEGPVPGVPPALQPVEHGLLNVRREAETVLDSASEAELWARPCGVAATGFHIRHLCGSIDRLFTYARGESLRDDQFAILADEKRPGSEPDGAALRALLTETMERAMTQLRATDAQQLDAPRAVGRLQRPSTVRGLLFHAAEHGARHAGQAITTLKVVRGGT